MPFAKQCLLFTIIILLSGCSWRNRVVDFGDGRYDGDLNGDGQRHGEGIYDWNNGDKYEGQFRFGKRHGKGDFVWANGDTFKGEYRNGKRHGRGSYQWTNGARYDGQYTFGKRHGRGTFVAADGTRYDGWWRDDEEEGHGVLTYPDGRRITGKWSRGILKTETSTETKPSATEEENSPVSSEPVATVTESPTPPETAPPVAPKPEQPEPPTEVVPTLPSDNLPPLPGEPVEPVTPVETPEPEPEPTPVEPKQPVGENWKGTQEQAEAYFESRDRGEVSALHSKENGEAFEGTITIVLDDGAKRGQVTVVNGLLHGEEILWGDDGKVMERNRYENGKLIEEQIVPQPEKN